MSTLEV